MNLYKRFLPGLAWVLTLAVSSIPMFGAPKTGILAVNPTNVSFGSVSLGTSLTQNVVLSNTGTGSVSIASASMSGAGFAVSGLTLPMTLAPGQSAALQVLFAPSSAGTVTGYVYLKKNNGTVLATISMSGSGVSAAPTVTQHSANLSWAPSTSSIIGYYVYRATQPGGPYARISTTTDPSTLFTDSTVVGGQVYYYVVTSVDANYVESAYSNVSTATIPQ